MDFGFDKMNDSLEEIDSRDLCVENWFLESVSQQPHQQNIQNSLEPEGIHQQLLNLSAEGSTSISQDDLELLTRTLLNERGGTPKPAGTPPSPPKDTRKRGHIQVSEVETIDSIPNKVRRSPSQEASPKNARKSRTSLSRHSSVEMTLDSPFQSDFVVGLNGSFGEGLSQDISSGAMNPVGVPQQLYLSSFQSQPQMTVSSQYSPSMFSPGSSPRGSPTALKREPSLSITGAIPSPIQRQGSSIQYMPNFPDVNTLKVALTEFAAPITKRDVRAYSQRCLEHLSTQLGLHNGGVFLLQATDTKWTSLTTYPSDQEFSKYFHFSVGERFIIQAATEKRCFSVHSNSFDNNDQLSFLFVPITNDSNTGNAVAVYVLGALLNREEDLHQRLFILDQVRKSISQNMVAMLTLHNNLLLLQRLDFVRYENEALRQRGLMEHALLKMLTANIGTGQDTALICTNVKGVIIYFSSGAESLLGYASDDVLHNLNLAQLHDFQELYDRAAELSREFNRQINPDFSAIVGKLHILGNSEDCRAWKWTRRDKDKTILRVSVTVKPLMGDDGSLYGYVVLAKRLM